MANICSSRSNCKECRYYVFDEEQFDYVCDSEDDVCDCSICNRPTRRSEMTFTYDCHGIPFRLVCYECYDKIMEDKGYDGEYYTELDECIDDEW